MHNVPLCIDGRMLGIGGTGVATYAQSLRAALALVGTERAILTAVPDPGPGGWHARLRRTLAALPPGPRTVRVATGRAATGERLLVSDDLFRTAQIHFDFHGRLLTLRVPGPPGIMHWTYPLPLHVAGWANIYTVHDLIPLSSPSLSPIDPHRHRRLLERIVPVAAALVTVSETSRREIVETLGCGAEMVADCGQAVSDAHANAALPHALVRDGYLLVCGTVERRKNIAAILAAYRSSGVTLPLVIAGPDGWDAEVLVNEIATTPGVVRLPYLEATTMRALIGDARALLMPSLAEGFGLPVAEAMALGTPCLTSAFGALAEIAGGAALLVDPADVPAMAAAIRLLATDQTARKVLSAYGRVAAERFTLQRFAARIAALHARFIAEDGSLAYPRRPGGSHA